MSGLRLSFALLALLAAVCLSTCTVRTHDYCDDARRIYCKGNLVCNNLHTCVPDAARPDSSDAADLASDRDGDGTTDARADGQGGDAGDHGDAVADDAVADAAEVADATGDRRDSAEVHTGCNVNDDCTADPNKPICESASGLCFGCLQSRDCRDSKAGVCDQSVKKCVQCLTGADCSDPATPICEAKVCRGCRADTECAGTGPAVCMSHLDGHCATDAETVYVQNVVGACSNTDPAAGTRTLPYCDSQLAVDSIAASRPIRVDAGADAGSARTVTKDLMVMRGIHLTEWSFSTVDRLITVVGQSVATHSPSPHIGIHVSAGTVYVRSVRVTGASVLPAIVADGGEIHLDRCVIDTSGGGGVLIDGAAYEITNSVIANDGPTSTDDCGAWGGLCIRHVPSGRLNRFLNNTVTANQQVGIACDGPYPIVASIAAGSVGSIDTTKCAFSACCSAGAPGVDPQTYHLQPGSPCIDQIASTVSTAYDIDGQPRPVNSFSDCGADEFVATSP